MRIKVIAAGVVATIFAGLLALVLRKKKPAQMHRLRPSDDPYIWNHEASFDEGKTWVPVHFKLKVIMPKKYKGRIRYIDNIKGVD